MGEHGKNDEKEAHKRECEAILVMIPVTASRNVMKYAPPKTTVQIEQKRMYRTRVCSLAELLLWCSLNCAVNHADIHILSKKVSDFDGQKSVCHTSMMAAINRIPKMTELQQKVVKF